MCQARCLARQAGRPPSSGIRSRNYAANFRNTALPIFAALVLAGMTALSGPAAAAQAVPTPSAAAVKHSTGAIPSPAPADDIHDIRGPISIPYDWLWAAYVAGGVALAAALYGAWRWYRSRSVERAKEPHEIALERLEKARELMQIERAREYSFAVSEITRTYIEARFQQRAARRTTEEFLYGLLAQADSPLAQHRALLEDFLQHCDLAKFAKWQLSVADMESMLESARAFILETRPQPDAKKSAAPQPAAPAQRPAEPQLTHSRP